MSNWNVNQYLKFENERTQPARDLAHRIHVKNPKKIIDIGCGPGNSTGILKEYFRDAEITGVDNAQSMIDQAVQNYPKLTFFRCDAEKELSVLGDGFDVVFPNACIQWIPNHPALIKICFSCLT